MRSAIVVVVLVGCNYNPSNLDGTDASDDAVATPMIDAAADAPAIDCLARWKTGPLNLSLPEPVANVSSVGEDRDPFISNDELSLIFATRRNGTQNSDVFTAKRPTRADAFSNPAPDTIASSPDEDSKVSISGDELQAFIATNRAPTEGNADIFTATRPNTTATFGNYTQTNLELVNDSLSQLDPEISFDGLHLYLAIELGGVQVIAMATRTATTDPFTAPVPVVNSTEGDADPTLSPDEQVIVFSSNRVGSSFGGGNLWYAVRADKSQPFSGTAFVVPSVNTNSNDGDPSLSRDGCSLYFASDRGIGGLDIYISRVID